MKKKIFLWLLSIMLLFQCMPITGLAVTEPIYQVSDRTVEINDTFTMDVVISNNPGIISLRFKVVYDSTALQLLEVTDNELLDGFTAPAPSISSPYTLRWADSLATQNNVSNGKVVTLKFKALKVTDTFVSIEHSEARNYLGEKISFANATSDVTIEAESPDPIPLQVGDMFIYNREEHQAVDLIYEFKATNTGRYALDFKGLNLKNNEVLITDQNNTTVDNHLLRYGRFPWGGWWYAEPYFERGVTYTIRFNIEEVEENAFFEFKYGDAIKPTIEVNSTYELSDKQTLSIEMKDNMSVDAFHILDESNHVLYETTLTYTGFPYTFTSYCYDYEISEPGTYTIIVEDWSGNSQFERVTFYRTEFHVDDYVDDNYCVLTAGGDTITPEKPEKEGFIFNGWSKDKEAESGVFEIKPTDNSTYYAIWQCKHGSIEFEYDRHPTCTEDGLGHWICVVCGEIINYSEVPKTSHNYNKSVVTQPTCTEQGYTTYTCTQCGDSYNDDYVKAISHKYDGGKITKPATYTEAGVKIYACTVCGEKLSAVTIPKIVSTTLSLNSAYYSGKVITPAVTLRDSKGKTLKKGTDYDVIYSGGRKYVGRYSVTIRFKGNYSGTKVLYFNIVPKGTSVTKLTAISKGFKVRWKMQKTQTTGYQIQYSRSSKFGNAKTITMSKNSYSAKNISKLSGKKRYYVRIRTYKITKVNGKNYKIYSPWSSAKYVKTK